MYRRNQIELFEAGMTIRAQEITKTYGPTIALSDVSIALESGKVHALVGENGAGKSTLFKILASYEKQDSGSVYFHDKLFDPDTQEQAKKSGIVLVMQELTINRSLGIAENIFIDRLRSFSNFAGIINRRTLYDKAQSILNEIGADISVKQDINTLDLGQLKIIEVARALSYEPKVIFLDESTAYLNNKEVTALLNVIVSLKNKGIAIGFVSHHLDEVKKIADQLTILKDGSFVGSYEAVALSVKEMESLMVGREMLFDFSDWKSCSTEKALFVMNKATIKNELEDVSLVLHEKEILGIGGLKGAGGEAILRVMVGDKAIPIGSMVYDEKVYKPKTPHTAWNMGIGYLPGSRTSEGLITEFNLMENTIMAKYPRKGVFLNVSEALKGTMKLIEYLHIKADTPSVPCSNLSGGNMQKVVLGKCLFPHPRILLLNNPTRGIDIGARFEIYRKIRELVMNENVSIILLSEDLMELMGLCGRIMIMNKGTVKKIFLRDDNPSEEDIISFMV